MPLFPFARTAAHTARTASTTASASRTTSSPRTDPVFIQLLCRYSHTLLHNTTQSLTPDIRFESLQALYAAQLMGGAAPGASPAASPNPFAQLLPDKLNSAAQQVPLPPAIPLSQAGCAGSCQLEGDVSFQLGNMSPSALQLSSLGLGAGAMSMEQLAMAAASGGKMEDLDAYLKAFASVQSVSEAATSLPASFPGSAALFHQQPPAFSLAGSPNHLQSNHLQPNQLQPNSGNNGNGNGNGIINQEAYCELCQKEFCNKYFLRTHKLKKHGIAPPEDSSPGNLKRPRPSPPSDVPPSMLPRTSDAHHASVIQSLFGGPRPPLKEEPIAKRPAPTDLLDRDATPPANGDPRQFKPELGAEAPNGENFPCAICGKTLPSYLAFLSHQYQEHPQLAPQLSASSLFAPQTNGQTTPSKDSPSGVGPHGHSSTTGIAITDPEAFCEICQKEFCSKYFLRQHKANIHGIRISPLASETPPSAASASPAKTGRTASFSSLSKTPTLTGVGAGAFPFPPPSSIGQALPPSPATLGSLFGHQMPTMVPQHGLNTPTTPSGPPSHQTKPRYSTGKNFCDICNKEVCNKYFLRTHMLKMHGIVIDEQKAVIGNINTLEKEKTGTLIFRCDLCSKDMRSRDELRQHKQDSHGILPRALPQAQPTPPAGPKLSLNGQLSNGSSNDSPGALQAAQDSLSRIINGHAGTKTTTPLAAALACPFCDATAKSRSELQTHVLKECPQRSTLLRKEMNGGGSDNSTSPSLSATSEHSSSAHAPALSDAVFKCELCDAQLPDALQKQLHLLAVHASQLAALPADQLALLTLMGGLAAPPPLLNGLNPPQHDQTPTLTQPQTQPDMEERQETVEESMKVYRCGECPYATKWASNLSVHQKRHAKERLLPPRPSADKPFACSVCLRSYRYAHTLERHKQCHRLATANPDLSLKYAHASPLKAEPATESAHRFRCAYCPQLFATRDAARTHQTAAHRLSPLRTPDKAAAAIVKGLVEELHQERQSVEERSLGGYGEPEEPPESPYVVQMFKVEAAKEDSALFGRMNLYLPVRKTVEAPLQLSLSLTPVSPHDSNIKSL